MKYAGMFNESIKSPPVCKSDKYGLNVGLENYANQLYGGIRTTTNHRLMQNEHRFERRNVHVDGYVTNQQQPIRNNRINSQSDRERRTSLYDQNRQTIEHSHKPLINYRPPTADMTTLHDMANNQRLNRHSTINYNEKYSRNYESKYKQDYDSKLRGVYENYKTSNGQNIPHSKENYQQSTFTSATFDSRSRAPPERAYNDLTSINTITHSRGMKPQTSNYRPSSSEKAYDCGAGKELLRNLDKVQQKIRSLLKQ